MSHQGMAGWAAHEDENVASGGRGLFGVGIVGAPPGEVEWEWCSESPSLTMTPEPS